MPFIKSPVLDNESVIQVRLAIEYKNLIHSIRNLLSKKDEKSSKSSFLLNQSFYTLTSGNKLNTFNALSNQRKGLEEL